MYIVEYRNRRSINWFASMIGRESNGMPIIARFDRDQYSLSCAITWAQLCNYKKDVQYRVRDEQTNQVMYPDV